MQLFRCHLFFFSVVLNIYLFIFCRGPQYGYRGKVLLAFEDNGSSKIGVRFDKAIPDGNDLGGLCEEDRGFFCPGDFLILYDLSLYDMPFLYFVAVFMFFMVESYMHLF